MNMERHQAFPPLREREHSMAPSRGPRKGVQPYASEPHPAISSVASVLSSRNGGDGLAGAVQELEIVRTVREGRPAERQQKDTDPLETAGIVVSPLPISDATGEQRIPDVLCSSTVTTWEVTARCLSNSLHSS